MAAGKSTRYTVAFVFDADLQNVLLVHKEKPDWQRGMLNGIGGKYEGDENPEACIRRETIEESGLDIPESAWLMVGTIRRGEAEVDVLTARYLGNPADAVMADYEKVEWFPVRSIPDNALDNLKWLIPLSLEKHQTGFRVFEIQY